MIEAMQIPPERLYGPDKSITFLRKYCQDHARGGRRTTSEHAGVELDPVSPRV